MRNLRMTKQFTGSQIKKHSWKRLLSLFLISGAITAIFSLSTQIQWSEKAMIALVIMLGFVFATMSLWSYATINANGSDW